MSGTDFFLTFDSKACILCLSLNITLKTMLCVPYVNSWRQLAVFQADSFSQRLPWLPVIRVSIFVSHGKYNPRADQMRAVKIVTDLRLVCGQIERGPVHLFLV